MHQRRNMKGTSNADIAGFEQAAAGYPADQPSGGRRNADTLSLYAVWQCAYLHSADAIPSRPDAGCNWHADVAIAAAAQAAPRQAPGTPSQQGNTVRNAPE